jgi:hypothetical protein
MHQIQVPLLSRSITENLRLDQFGRAEVIFCWGREDIYVELDHPQGEYRQAQLSLKILVQEWLDMQVPSSLLFLIPPPSPLSYRLVSSQTHWSAGRIYICLEYTHRSCAITTEEEAPQRNTCIPQRTHA